MATPLRSRVRQILDDQGITQTRLAEVAGLKRAAVSYWIANGISMGYLPALKLHREFGYSIRWLMRGEGDRYDNSSPDIDEEHQDLILLWDSLIPTQRAEMLQRMRALKESNSAILQQLNALSPRRAKART